MGKFCQGPPKWWRRFAAAFRQRTASAAMLRRHRPQRSDFILVAEELESRLAPAVVTYVSTDVPKDIPDLHTIVSTLAVPVAFTVTDLNVRLNITHPWDEDLDVFLIGPDGTRVELFTDDGSDGENFTNTVLDDQAGKSITLGTAPFNGSFKPEGLLSAFNGKNPKGTWQLEVTDDEELLDGTLNSWSLTFTQTVQTSTLFKDSDGDQVSLKLSGAGSVAADPVSHSVWVSGSNAATTLTITVTKGLGGDGRWAVNSLQASALGSMTAPAVQLAGNLQVNNYLTNLSLWGMNGTISATGFGAVTLGGGGSSGKLIATAKTGLNAGIKTLTIQAGNLSGEIRSAGPVGNLQVLKSTSGQGGALTHATIWATAFTSIKIAGKLTDARLLASKFPTTVTVNGAVINPLNNSSFVVMANRSLSGSVAKGPVTGASVTFYLLNPDGTIGPQFGQTFTDANATFTVGLLTPTNQPFLAVARAGSYIDEVTGAIVNLNATDELAAVLPAGTTRAAITPLTNMAAALARAQAGANPAVPLATAIANANNAVAIQYNVANILTIPPVAANDEEKLKTASLQQRSYGLVLAGITQLAADDNVRAADLAAWLAADFSDGILDGLKNGADIPIQTLTGETVTLPPTTGTTDLQAAINAFITSGNNKTNLVELPIALTPVQYGLNAAARLYTTSTVLPAAVSGQAYTTTLSAKGGTLPYTWTVQSGALPPGFALSPQGVITADAAATTLPLGTTMIISPPFIVRLTDAAGNTRDIEMRITIVVPGPQITGLDPAETVEGEDYTGHLIASGGQAPYYWYNNPNSGGFRPFWLSIDLDGTVHGTPPANSTGIYTFGVTVVDLIGQTKSASVSLIVQRAPGIVVKPTAGLVTTEAGGTASFTVSLHSQPKSNVTIPIESSDTTEGKVSPSTLTFTSVNWDVPQKVTVTGVDDNVVDGNIAYTVSVGPATSGDPNYDGLAGDDVALINKDNDLAPGILVAPTSGLVTTESGGTASFSVVLHSRPTANVTIPISSSDTTEGTVLPTSLVFTSTNWNIPQTVTVKGVNDSIVDGDIAYTVKVGPAVSADANYNGRSGPNVAVTNKDNDVLSGNSLTILSKTVTTGADGYPLITITGTATGLVGAYVWAYSAFYGSSGPLEIVADDWSPENTRHSGQPVTTSWTFTESVYALGGVTGEVITINVSHPSLATVKKSVQF